MSTDPVCVVVNPAAAGGRGRKAGRRVVEALAGAVPFQAHLTEGPGHASQLAAEAAAEGASRVLAVGGDGTVHEVAAGLLAADRKPLPSLAVHPVGTGNDFFRMTGGGRRPEDARTVLQGGVVQRFDVGRVQWDGGERTFVNLLGVGVDVDVLRRRAKYARLPGLAQYLAAFLDAVVRFRPPKVRIDARSATSGEADRVRVSGPATLAAITVGPSIGGGFMINPTARASDGRLDLCHVRALNWREVAGLVPRVIRGTHGACRQVTLGRLDQAVVRSADSEPIHFELDGELVPTPARELRVQVMPGALPVLVPPRADAPAPVATQRPRRRSSAPSTRVLIGVLAAAALAVSAALLPAAPAPAQEASNATVPDSILAPPASESASDSASGPGPAGAFLRGVLVPGWGHTVSGATTRGAFYFGAESLAGWMLYKTVRRLGTARQQAELRERRVGEALAAQGVEDAAEREAALEADDDVARARGLVAAREEQREDWIAVAIFTLLLSGLDAFVSAHLQDFPEPLTIEGDPAVGRVEVGFRVPAPAWRRPTPASRAARARPFDRW